MPESFPWLYPYAAERATRRGREVLRPVVPVSIVGTRTITPRVGLVDTGAEHVLADAWLAESAGVDPQTDADILTVGIGGQIVEVTFAEVELRHRGLGGLRLALRDPPRPLTHDPVVRRRS